MPKKKTYEEFVNEVYDLVQDEYSVLGEYVNTDTKILMIHNTCKHEYEVRPYHFLQGTKCPKCAITIRQKSLVKDIDKFKKEVYDLVADEYEVLGEYVTNKIKILMKHNICGHEYLVSPDNFLRNNRCPKCQVISKAEILIAKFLDYNEIQYEEQKTFPECKHINLLKFDFYVPNVIQVKTGKKVNLLIEYNGIQHYKPCFGTGLDDKEKTFQLNKLRDQIKRDFIKCGQKDLRYDLCLITIPHTFYNNLEEYLVKVFNEKYNIS